ncbi:MAG: V-type ATP synthase subunit A, partial [bacterium]
MSRKTGSVIYINGPVVKGRNMRAFKMREMVLVGKSKLIGEVISVDENIGTLQVYEESEGLGIEEEIHGLGNPLSINLGPGLLGNIFDGIGRPLDSMTEIDKTFIPEGIGLTSIDFEKEWSVNIKVEKGDKLEEGFVYGTLKETELIQHKLMIPTGLGGKVSDVNTSVKYNLNDTLISLKDKNGNIHEIKMHQKWPVRKPRPV